MIDRIPSAEQKEIKNENTPPLNEVVAKLLQDPEVGKLPPEAQGKVIADRFIGALVRHGDIASKNTEIGAMTPAHILSLVDKIGTQDKDGYITTTMALTRTDGLRAGVDLLTQDERVGSIFGKFSSLLGVETTAEGKDIYTLTSEAQLDGYVDAGGPKNNKYNAGQYEDPTEWIGPFMADTHDVINGHGEWRSDATLASDIRDKGAVTPDYFKTARELYEARMQAHHAGIDLGVVRRSAEYMRARDDYTKHEAGERVLFLATGGKLNRYKTNQDAWFQRHIGRI